MRPYFLLLPLINFFYTAHEVCLKPFCVFVPMSVCADGFFGPSCQRQCHCGSDSVCDKQTGDCPAGCANGWIGPACRTGGFLFFCRVLHFTTEVHVWPKTQLRLNCCIWVSVRLIKLNCLINQNKWSGRLAKDSAGLIKLIHWGYHIDLINHWR